MRQDLEQEQQDEPAADIDVDAVADQLKRDAKFVFGPQAKDDKIQYAEREIRREYDAADSAVEWAAAEAVSAAISDLQFEGIIDSSYNPKVDGEDREEKIANFKQVMGVHDAEADADSDAETDAAVAEGDEADAPEMPGAPWDCPCNTHNEADRSVCRGCGEVYDPETAEHTGDGGDADDDSRDAGNTGDEDDTADGDETDADETGDADDANATK